MMDDGKPSLFQLVFLFWVIMDALGTLPIFVSLLKHFDPKKQMRIVTRELLIALGIMVAFLFFGKGFFLFLHITQSSLQVAGGILIFLLAIKMIFSVPGVEKQEGGRIPKDPLIVPLAIPLVAGPGILATITLYGSGGLVNRGVVLAAIIIAWLLSLPLLLFAPWLTRILGVNGVAATEKLFGYILALISIQMTVTGLIASFS